MRYFCNMKIGFDAKRIYHNTSGLGNYGRYVISQLSRRHPDWGLSLMAGKPSDLWKGKGDYVTVPPPAGLRRMLSMDTIWAAQGIDLYHGLSNELPLRSRSKIAKVVTIHDLLYMDFPVDYPWLDRQIYDLKFRKSAKAADIVVAISETTKKDLIKRFGTPEEKIRVVYQSCDPRFFEVKPEMDIKTLRTKVGLAKPYLLCVSSFSQRKNQHRLLEAFAQSSIIKDVDLVFIGGENDVSRRLQRQVSRRGLDANVRFLGEVMGEDLPTFIQGSMALIYPSVKEGFGIPVIEGMASGVPVLTSKGTSCEEAGGEAVLTFEPLSVDEMVKALERIVEDETLRQTLVKKGRIRAEAFSPDIEMPKLEQAYQEAISRAS
jgi:glycosyltransferase involved in cell wall biosynthesis